MSKGPDPNVLAAGFRESFRRLHDLCGFGRCLELAHRERTEHPNQAPNSWRQAGILICDQSVGPVDVVKGTGANRLRELVDRALAGALSGVILTAEAQGPNGLFFSQRL